MALGQHHNLLKTGTHRTHLPQGIRFKIIGIAIVCDGRHNLMRCSPRIGRKCAKNVVGFWVEKLNLRSELCVALEIIKHVRILFSISYVFKAQKLYYYLDRHHLCISEGNGLASNTTIPRHYFELCTSLSYIYSFVSHCNFIMLLLKSKKA